MASVTLSSCKSHKTLEQTTKANLESFGSLSCQLSDTLFILPLQSPSIPADTPSLPDISRHLCRDIIAAPSAPTLVIRHANAQATAQQSTTQQAETQAHWQNHPTTLASAGSWLDQILSVIVVIGCIVILIRMLRHPTM